MDVQGSLKLVLLTVVLVALLKGFQCQNAVPCLLTEFKCPTTQQCIPERLVCDGTADCTDGGDETSAQCGTGAASLSSCKPQPSWLNQQSEQGFAFHRIWGKTPDAVVYRVGCKDGYKMCGQDMEKPILVCSRGRILSAPSVKCHELTDQDTTKETCYLYELSSDYTIMDRHNDQFDLDQDREGNKALKPGMVVTVQCKRGTKKRGKAYCRVDGTFQGLPEC